MAYVRIIAKKLVLDSKAGEYQRAIFISVALVILKIMGGEDFGDG